MKNSEVKFLVDKKTKEGKETKQIYEEINNLKNTLKGYNTLKQENKSLKIKLFNQEKRITNLKDQLNKQKKKIFDLTMKKDIEKDIHSEKKSSGAFANVYHLKRILNYLEENPKAIKTRIKEGCCINFEQLNSGLLFLERVNLIKQEGAIYERKI